MSQRAVHVGACLLSVALAAASLSALRADDQNGGHRGKLLAAFDAMYGVDGPFVGDGFTIRGIPGDELPWVVRSAVGTLDTQGHLRIKIRGLVFANTDEVPAELRGKNDEATFRALVSCWSEEEDGDEEQVTTVNVITRGFRATRRGDSDIRATIELPNPCVAPIIMVLAGSEDKWFAINGFER